MHACVGTTWSAAVGIDNDFINFMLKQRQLGTRNRSIRLHLAHPKQLTDNVLLPQFVSGTEAICDGLEYRVNCVATADNLPLKEFIGLPARLEFVTDRGQLRKVTGLVAEASSGDSDGAIASYQLVIRDALSVMGKRINTRIFRNMNEGRIAELILTEWWHINPGLVGAFDFEFADSFDSQQYPAREQTLQFNESDSAFLRRLLARAGIGWFVRTGRSRAWQKRNSDDGYPAHTLVIFNDQNLLQQNAAGTVRYHRGVATEKRDTITRWSGIRKLQAGSTSRFSWDYKNTGAPGFMMAETSSQANQGMHGNSIASGLNEFIVEAPHVTDSYKDLCRLGALRMQRRDFETKCFHGEGSVRDFCAGEYFSLAGHPEIDRHSTAERDFVITAVRVAAQNNLPEGLMQCVQRLFARNAWLDRDNASDGRATFTEGQDEVRFHMQFTAVRRTVPIVPAYDPLTATPRPGLQLALVVAHQGEEVYCDQLGRVKIRFPFMRAADHEHARSTGVSNTPADSAWVRVASNWAGSKSSHCGTVSLPRAGTEVLVDFLGGDPDKPIIVGQLYNSEANPAPLSYRAVLPETRYLSGIRSQEIRGQRSNQLCFDDTPGQICAQLSSDEGTSQLNLGWLIAPRGDRYEPRGEGAELRSDKAVAIRGGQGVLITAKESSQAGGRQLDRDELIGVAEGLRNIADQLAKLAHVHACDAAAGPELSELVDKLKHLHQGSNVTGNHGAQAGNSGGAPIVAIGGPAGIVVASEQNLALGAKTNADLITAANTNLSAGGSTSLRAAEGVSVFANNGGIKTVAARGKVQSQAQDDAMELLAKKVLEIISTTDWINIKAKQGVRIYGGGSELQISADGIIGYTTGNNYVYAADHQTFPKQARPTQFAGELPHHDICIPCMLLAAKAHLPLVESE
jgi:type VI secretion system secreted protein VgrG